MGGRGASPSPDYVARSGEAADHAFVFATWLRCYKHSSAFARRIADATFYRHHHAIVASLLARAELRVVVLSGDPGIILGYSVSEPGTIHFVYVKKPFRRRGIGSELLAHLNPDACAFTHWTDGWEYLHRKWPHAEYNPYAL